MYSSGSDNKFSELDTDVFKYRSSAVFLLHWGRTKKDKQVNTATAQSGSVCVICKNPGQLDGRKFCSSCQSKIAEFMMANKNNPEAMSRLVSSPESIILPQRNKAQEPAKIPPHPVMSGLQQQQVNSTQSSTKQPMIIDEENENLLNALKDRDREEDALVQALYLEQTRERLALNNIYQVRLENAEDNSKIMIQVTYRDGVNSKFVIPAERVINSSELPQEPTQSKGKFGRLTGRDKKKNEESKQQVQTPQAYVGTEVIHSNMITLGMRTRIGKIFTRHHDEFVGGNNSGFILDIHFAKHDETLHRIINRTVEQLGFVIQARATSTVGYIDRPEPTEEEHVDLLFKVSDRIIAKLIQKPALPSP